MACISRISMAFSDQGVKWALAKPRKAQRQSALKVFSLKRLSSQSNICPVACLGAYVKASDERRKDAEGCLFVRTRSPFKAIGASTVSRWVKVLLTEASIDTTVYSAHSTRGASASKAAASGVSVENILRSGGWASESVFSRHYRRWLETGTDVADSILIGGNGSLHALESQG